MVKITVRVATDLTFFGLSDVMPTLDTRVLNGNVFEKYGGVSYEDRLTYTYNTIPHFGSQELLVYGTGLQVGGSGITAGTVHAFFDRWVANGIPTYGHLFEGLTLGGKALQGVMATANVLDDVELLAQQLIGKDTFVLSEFNDTARGYAGSDRISGNGGNDSLMGDAGNDTLIGGAGDDTLIGGTGADLYYVDASDTVIELVGGGIDAVVSAYTFNLHDNVENLSLTGSASINAYGNALKNTLKGNDGNNRLVGLGGNDILDGGAGIDTLLGGGGNDIYYAAASDLIVELADGGRDFVFVSTSMTLSENVENATIQGVGSYSVTGNGGNNQITGNGGANTLRGLAGTDILSSGAGADIIDGGLGGDVLNGGFDSVRDVFVFRTSADSLMAQNRDTIVSFKQNIDQIDLSRIDAQTGATATVGAQHFVFNGTTAVAGGVWYGAVTGGIVVRADVTGDAVADMEIMLNAVTALTAADFILA